MRLGKIIASLIDKKEAQKLAETTPLVILMIGINGGGKTTSIGKLSNRLKNQGLKVMLAAADTFRAAAAEQLAAILKEKGCLKVAITDLAREDMAEALEDAFRYGKVILAASSYNGGVAPFMEDFLHHLKAKNYQKRTVGFVENGTWAPVSAKQMRALLEGMKEINMLDPTVTIRSTLNADSEAQMDALVEALLAE